jgi:hypothetical protein
LRQPNYRSPSIRTPKRACRVTGVCSRCQGSPRANRAGPSAWPVLTAWTIRGVPPRWLMPVVFAEAAGGHHNGAIRLAPIAKPMRASWRRGPADRRSARRRRASHLTSIAVPAAAGTGRPSADRRAITQDRAARSRSRPGPPYAACPLALMAVRYLAFLAAIDLHVGNVRGDRDRPGGRCRRPLRRQQRQYPNLTVLASEVAN